MYDKYCYYMWRGRVMAEAVVRGCEQIACAFWDVGGDWGGAGTRSSEAAFGPIGRLLRRTLCPYDPRPRHQFEIRPRWLCEDVNRLRVDEVAG